MISSISYGMTIVKLRRRRLDAAAFTPVGCEYSTNEFALELIKHAVECSQDLLF